MTENPGPTRFGESQKPRLSPRVKMALSALGGALATLVIVGVVFGLTGLGTNQCSDSPTVNSGAAGATPPSEAAPDFPQSHTDPKILEVLAKEISRDPADPRAKGKVDAPVVLVAYSDFSCPMCTRFATEIEPELKDLIDDGTLRIEYRDLVVFPNYGADIAAMGGVAAGKQGKFWQFHDLLFAKAGNDHPQYTKDSVLALAKEAQIPDLAAFARDLDDPKTKAAVDESTRNAAEVLGFNGTPSFICNKTAFSGAQPVEIFRSTILDQAKQAGK